MVSQFHKPINFFLNIFLILGLSSTKNNEYPMSSYNSPITYDILRARNRQDFEKTQPSKPLYRYTVILTKYIFLVLFYLFILLIYI
jgi:hypothetical protein